MIADNMETRVVVTANGRFLITLHTFKPDLDCALCYFNYHPHPTQDFNGELRPYICKWEEKTLIRGLKNLFDLPLTLTDTYTYSYFWIWAQPSNRLRCERVLSIT